MFGTCKVRGELKIKKKNHFEKIDEINGPGYVNVGVIDSFQGRGTISLLNFIRRYFIFYPAFYLLATVI